MYEYQGESGKRDAGPERCPVCGGTQFEDGQMTYYVSYTPGSNLWFPTKQRRVKARRCMRCDHLLLFAGASTYEGWQRRLSIILIALVLIFLVSMVLMRSF
jgi:hypothetical protein